MTEELWNERRAHLQTKMQLYQAQNAVLNELAQKAQAELTAMGDKWVPDETPPAA